VDLEAEFGNNKPEGINVTTRMFGYPDALFLMALSKNWCICTDWIRIPFQ